VKSRPATFFAFGRPFGVSAAALAIVAGSLVPTTGALASPSVYYPSGPQANVSKSTVTAGGWTLCWSEGYGGISDMRDVVLGTDDNSVAPCNGSALLLTGWANNNDSNLVALAAAPRGQVFRETPMSDEFGVPYPKAADGWNSHWGSPGDIYTNPHLSNGSYWYYTPGVSMGFTPVRTLSQWPGDSCLNDTTQATRLSWHMYDGAHPYSVNGGFSLGTNCWLNGGSSPFTRAIYTSNSMPVPRLLAATSKFFKRNFASLAGPIGVARPAGGSFSVSVAAGSEAVCYVDGNFLRGRAAGDCDFTLSSLNGADVVMQSKAGSFTTN